MGCVLCTCAPGCTSPACCLHALLSGTGTGTPWPFLHRFWGRKVCAKPWLCASARPKLCSWFGGCTRVFFFVCGGAIGHILSNRGAAATRVRACWSQGWDFVCVCAHVGVCCTRRGVLHTQGCTCTQGCASRSRALTQGARGRHRRGRNAINPPFSPFYGPNPHFTPPSRKPHFRPFPTKEPL